MWVICVNGWVSIFEICIIRNVVSIMVIIVMMICVRNWFCWNCRLMELIMFLKGVCVI